MNRSEHAHTTLLVGDAAAGRALVLQETARALCREKNAPCGDCPVCRRVFSGEHPDLHILDNGDDPIRIEDVRALIAEEAVRPFEADFKVYLILHAEKMTPASQNALLKTLEEPDGDVRFYLTADSADPILPTILSRCALRRVDKTPLSVLEEKGYAAGLTRSAAHLAAMLADGSEIKVRALTDDQSVLENGIAAAEALCDVLANGARGVTALYPYVSKKEDALHALIFWRALLRDMMTGSSHANGAVYYMEKPKDFADSAGHLGVRGALRLLSALDEMQMQIEGNISAPLAADRFFTAVLKEKRA